MVTNLRTQGKSIKRIGKKLSPHRCGLGGCASLSHKEVKRSACHDSSRGNRRPLVGIYKNSQPKVARSALPRVYDEEVARSVV